MDGGSKHGHSLFYRILSIHLLPTDGKTPVVTTSYVIKCDLVVATSDEKSDEGTALTIEDVIRDCCKQLGIPAQEFTSWKLCDLSGRKIESLQQAYYYPASSLFLIRDDCDLKQNEAYTKIRKVLKFEPASLQPQKQIKKLPKQQPWALGISLISQPVIKPEKQKKSKMTFGKPNMKQFATKYYTPTGSLVTIDKVQNIKPKKPAPKTNEKEKETESLSKPEKQEKQKIQKKEKSNKKIPPTAAPSKSEKTDKKKIKDQTVGTTDNENEQVFDLPTTNVQNSKKPEIDEEPEPWYLKLGRGAEKPRQTVGSFFADDGQRPRKSRIPSQDEMPAPVPLKGGPPSAINRWSIPITPANQRTTGSAATFTIRSDDKSLKSSVSQLAKKNSLPTEPDVNNPHAQEDKEDEKKRLDSAKSVRFSADILKGAKAKAGISSKVIDNSKSIDHIDNTSENKPSSDEMEVEDM